jgi:uncharacterized protein (DUF1778 family)
MDKRLGFAATAAEERFITQAAARSGQRVSVFLRQAALRAAGMMMSSRTHDSSKP